MINSGAKMPHWGNNNAKGRKLVFIMAVMKMRGKLAGRKCTISLEDMLPKIIKA